MSRTYEQLEPVISALDERIKTNLGAYPTDTASGAVASFPDGADDIPLKSLVVNIDPVQSGSGDPSPDNVRPISGWTQVNVSHSDADMSNPTTLTISLGQTVYGGHLDVLSGELVIDRAMRTLTGADDWVLDADLTSRDGVTCLRTYFAMNDLKKPVGNIGDRTYIGVIITSNLQTVKNGYINQFDMDGIDIAITGYAGNAAYNYLYIIVNKSTMPIRTIADLKAWLAENNVQFCYELATPITITLTPHEVRSLLGQNNIFADTGDVSVEYRADTKMYIERLTEPDADMIADANITSGSYFMVGNNLYLATANIASGGQVIVGTNCTRKSLATALNEINQ